MEKEIEAEVADEVVESDATVEAQVEKPKFTGKQQEELNRLLAAERKSEATKAKRAQEKAQAEWQATEATLRSQIAEFEAGLETVISTLTADFDPLVLSLLHDRPVLEQWKKLQDDEFVKSARRQNVSPITPKTPEGDRHETKTLRFGQRQ